MNSGTFFVPSFVNEHAEGSWTAVLVDGAHVGTIEVKQGIAAGLRDAFDLIGADPADFCLVQFNFKDKTAMVKVGGSDLEDLASSESVGDVQDEESDELDEFEDDLDADVD